MSQQMMPLHSSDRSRRARFARRARLSPAGAARLARVLAGLASFAYAAAVCVGGPVPRLGVVTSTTGAVAVDVLLLAALALHFHFVERPGAPLLPRACAALPKVALLVALFFGLWQPLPMHVWAFTTSAAVVPLWLGYAAGWALLLLRAKRPACLVAGVALVEWSAPTLSLGHLVFAIGLTAFVVAYRVSLAQSFRMPIAY
jgi:hypothetical protein